MNTLIVYPTKNQIKNDAKGAFIPSARAFKEYRKNCGDTVAEYLFDPHLFTRSQLPDLYTVIRSGPFECVALFTHGVATSLPQLKIKRTDCKEFAQALTANVDMVTIGLYACLTACPLVKALNFAETLATELVNIGKPFRLLTHRTAGHTTRNPNVTLFPGDLRIDYPNNLDTERKKIYREEMKNGNLPFELLFKDFE